MSKEIIEAAGKAAEVVILAPTASNIILKRIDILHWGGIEPLPDSATIKEFKARSLLEVEFFNYWRVFVHKGIGRWPKTIRTEGFRLLDPNEVVPDAEADLYKKVRTALRREKFIVRHVNIDGLDANERQERQDALTRNAWLRQAVECIRDTLPPPSHKSMVPARDPADIPTTTSKR